MQHTHDFFLCTLECVEAFQPLHADQVPLYILGLMLDEVFHHVLDLRLEGCKKISRSRDFSLIALYHFE